MSKRSLVVALAAVVVLAGCVTVPTGPAVPVMPGYQKSMDQFRADDGDCRNYAYAAIGGPNAGQPAADAAAGNAVVGAAIGAGVGALLGAATGNAGNGAAWGAGTGLLFGSAAGSNNSGYSSYALQRQYDVAYMQCMYARGNQVPGQVAYRGQPYRPPNTSWIPPSTSPVIAPPPNPVPGSYPPPNYPPPNYPPPSYPSGSTPGG
jgi:hypothetical protein